MDNLVKIKIDELVFKSLEGIISKEEYSELESLLKSNSQALEYYASCIDFNLGMRKLGTCTAIPLQMEMILQELAEYEKTAPEIEIPKGNLSKELIPKIVYPSHENRKLSKFRLFSLAMSTAAVLFFILFLRFAPKKPYIMEVATLIDQMNVQWADSNVNFKTGDRLWTNQEPISLKKGIVKIQYDDGVDVLIEGPANFAVERSGVYLEYGRLFSHVSESGLGFLVETPTTRFVDQGTEFGIRADVDGSAELHVIKGKVQLFANMKDGSKIGQLVTANKAVKYDADRGDVKDIKIQKEAFIRAIDSSRGCVWRGQDHLSLPDIVAGGDGLGTGDYRNKIDYYNGKTIREDKSPFRQRNDPNYIVVNNPYIDGVFIPDGGEAGQVVVSSEGDVYHSCPDTCGRGSRIIVNHVKRVAKPEDNGSSEYIITLDGKTYGTIESPSLFMHANNAMTFNLDNIRKKHSNFTIRSFSVLCGLSDSILLTDISEPSNVSAEFIVLVDGQERYRGLAYPVDTAVTVNVKIEQDDRFLTLMVISGQRGYGHNWCIWARPFLDIELAEY